MALILEGVQADVPHVVGGTGHESPSHRDLFEFCGDVQPLINISRKRGSSFSPENSAS
jgi:hypothetical protein